MNGLWIKVGLWYFLFIDVKFVVFLVLFYMVNEEENKKILVDEILFDFFLEMVKKVEKVKDCR